MIEKLITLCVRNKFLTIFFVAAFFAAGLWALNRIPLDALPDLSDVQVIVYTNWEGQNPNLIEDQLTYPIVSALISAPKVKTVRGYSFFGFSYVYVIFQDGTDLYWARSRVLEYLNGLRGQLPEGVNPNLGPDATGVGWGFQYVLLDKTGRNSLADLRTFQDWDLSYWLRAVPGVAEVSSAGGFQKQYQIEVDPVKLASYGIGLNDVLERVRDSNGDVGGRVVEWTGREYMVRGRGYIQGLEDLRKIAVKVGARTGTPVYLSDVAKIHFGPEMRRGVMEWNGQGEAVGGVVVVRAGENVARVVEAVKEKIASVKSSFPPGVELEIAYDRSDLIERAVSTLKKTLIEEVIVVAFVILIFLFHFRSALVPITVLPVAIVISFLPMALLRVSSNIMSLGGLALAIGVLVDASIVMVENAHRHLAAAGDPRGPGPRGDDRRGRPAGRPGHLLLAGDHRRLVPAGLSPDRGGRKALPPARVHEDVRDRGGFDPLDHPRSDPDGGLDARQDPLRGRKSGGARDAAPLAPVLNSRFAIPETALLLNFLLIPAVVPLALSLGSEFMPQLREGSLMYMPTGLPMMAVEQARDILVKTDRIIMTFPEVQSVLGKSGKFESSTDPAPIEMFETTIVLKPRESGRRPSIAAGIRLARLGQAAPSARLARDANPNAGRTSRRVEREASGSRHARRVDPADPQPPGHAGDRRADEGRSQGLRLGLLGDREGQPRHRERLERPAGRAQRLCRADDRRLLSRLRRGPGRGRPIRAHSDADREHARGGHRRQDRGDDRRGEAPVHGSRALSARLPQRPGAI